MLTPLGASDELSGTGANEISFGTMLALSLTQPRVCGDDKVGLAEITCLYTVA